MRKDVRYQEESDGHSQKSETMSVVASKLEDQIHPERIKAVITQNGNAYEEGLLSSFDPIRTYWKNPSEENKENIRKLLVADLQNISM